MAFPPFPGMPSPAPSMGLPPPPGGMGMPGMPPPMMPPMPGMPDMGGAMGMPPEIASMMEALAGINKPSAQTYIDHAVECLNMARKADDMVAPVVGRAIDILKGSCDNGNSSNDDDGDENSPAGPSFKSSSY